MREGNETTALEKRPPLGKGLLRLCLALAALAGIIHFTPYLVNAFGPLREYNRVLKETEIVPGALYYSDVPQTADGEFNNRDAIRFRVRK